MVGVGVFLQAGRVKSIAASREQAIRMDGLVFIFFYFTVLLIRILARLNAILARAVTWASWLLM